MQSAASPSRMSTVPRGRATHWISGSSDTSSSRGVPGSTAASRLTTSPALGRCRRVWVQRRRVRDVRLDRLACHRVRVEQPAEGVAREHEHGRGLGGGHGGAAGHVLQHRHLPEALAPHDVGEMDLVAVRPGPLDAQPPFGQDVELVPVVALAQDDLARRHPPDAEPAGQHASCASSASAKTPTARRLAQHVVVRSAVAAGDRRVAGQPCRVSPLSDRRGRSRRSRARPRAPRSRAACASRRRCRAAAWGA